MSPKKAEILIVGTIALAVLLLGSIIFNGCNKEPKIIHIEPTQVNHHVVDSLKQEIKNLAIRNIELEKKSFDAESQVKNKTLELNDLKHRYQLARVKKDTVESLALCDTIIRENDMLASYIDSSYYAHRLQVSGLKTQINVQAITIDTLTAQNHLLEIDNKRIVGIANANADAANKANKKLKGSKFLNRILAGTVLALGAIIAITN